MTMIVVEELEVTHDGSNVFAVLSVVAGVSALDSMVGLGIPVPAACPCRRTDSGTLKMRHPRPAVGSNLVP